MKKHSIALIGFLGFLSINCYAIHGGKAVKGQQFDAVVSIGINGRGFCSGTLISSNQVLTAAHCVIDAGEGMFNDKRYFIKNPKMLTVSKNNGKATPIDERYVFEVHSTVKRIKISKSYLETDSVDAIDLAVLELQNPIPYQQKVKLLPLDFDYSRLKTPVTAVGYGYTSKYTHSQKNVANLSLESVSNHKNFVLISAGDIKSGICSGDSGGPIFLLNGSDYYLLGVTSYTFGSDYCDIGSVGAFYSPSSISVRKELGL